MSGSKLCFVVTVLPLPFAVNASEDCATHHEDLLPCSDFHVPPPDIGKQGEDSEDAPMLELTIGSWLPEGEPDSPDTRAYVVLKHTFADDDA